MSVQQTTTLINYLKNTEQIQVRRIPQEAWELPVALTPDIDPSENALVVLRNNPKLAEGFMASTLPEPDGIQAIETDRISEVDETEAGLSVLTHGGAAWWICPGSTERISGVKLAYHSTFTWSGKESNMGLNASFEGARARLWRHLYKVSDEEAGDRIPISPEEIKFEEVPTVHWNDEQAEDDLFRAWEARWDDVDLRIEARVVGA